MNPPNLLNSARSRNRRRTSKTKLLIIVVSSFTLLLLGYRDCFSTNSLHALAFSPSPYLPASPWLLKTFYRSHYCLGDLFNHQKTTRRFDFSAAQISLNMEGLHKKKRRKTMSISSTTHEIEDSFLTLIPKDVLSTPTMGGEDIQSPSLKFLPLPSRLAYPFWYDPHPIAKWAADQLKSELPSYDTTSNAASVEMNPTIALGKMYGVLVVSLGDEGDTNDSPSAPPQKKLGYLKAYSGTMPRPQYGGSIASASAQSNSRFVPPVYDRFEKASGEKKGDGFFYEREEEILNGLTMEIQRLESCPKRKKEIEDWKETEAKLQKQITDAKKLQKINKRKRRDRRVILREKLLADDNNSECKNYMTEKEAHLCFMEYNDEYRKHEEQLVQESAFDQREFKTLKAAIETELQNVQKVLNDYQSEIESLKKQRKNGSNELQTKLFDHYKLLNIHGETKTPLEIFKDTPLKFPPSGTGDCAAIKLFQHAFSKGYQPVALAEFWWGPSPPACEGDVARTHGNYYPCCRGKCEPILTRHMLLGIDVESDPLIEGLNAWKESKALEKNEGRELSIVYEDEWLVVVNKPHNVLSVPGRNVQDSIKKDLQKRYTNATGPLLVHRLDYSTSGLLLAAKDSDTHKNLQAQFIDRSVEKRYEALLEGDLLNCGDNNGTSAIQKKGTINLPLAGDYFHRPMQKVERGPRGKSAVTLYEVVETVSSNETKVVSERNGVRTRVYFYPKTGRTHQLRVHASHPEGLGLAIVGDDIYGQRDKRLCLHAGLLTVYHPHKRERITFHVPAPF